MQSKEPKVNQKSDYYLYLPSITAYKIYLYPVAVGYFYYEAGYHLIRSNYDSFLLMQIIKGNCTIKINEKYQTANAGNFVLLDCHRLHEYSFPTDSEALWIHFDGPLARNYFDLITSAHGNILSPERPHTITEPMSEILSSFRSSAPLQESILSERLTKTLEELLNSSHVAENSPVHSRTIENTLAYINEHFSEELTLEDLAETANLSPYYFTRVFTTETGLTPHQYLIAVRLNSAKFLLKSQGMSIKEIAFSSGFNSESNFCSTFKKWEHLTPSEYRAQTSA